MKNEAMRDPAYRQKLVEKLSRDGKFVVVFGEYPEYPDVFEFIDNPNNPGKLMRYINLCAREGACITKILEL